MTVGLTPVVIARERLTDKLSLVRFITRDFGESEVVMSNDILMTEREIEVLKVMMEEARANRDAVHAALQ